MVVRNRLRFARTVIGVVAVLATAAACGGTAGNVSPPATHATTAAPTSDAARAQAAVASVNALAPLQQAVNTCMQAVATSIGGQLKDATISAALKNLLGKKAADAADVVRVAQNAANDTVDISYKLQNGQILNATFDSGRVIAELLGTIPGFTLFGIIGDPAIYCTEAGFWYTGQLGGQLGTLLRAKLLTSATATASIQGTWTLNRAAASVCMNLPAGCADSPIHIQLSNCTANECGMSRTDGVWQTSHPITRNGSTWTAKFRDTAISCGTSTHDANIVIEFSVTSDYTRDGVLSAKSLGGTYAINETLDSPDCKIPAGLESKSSYELYGSRL
jgi:hypothetical protein